MCGLWLYVQHVHTFQKPNPIHRKKRTFQQRLLAGGADIVVYRATAGIKCVGYVLAVPRHHSYRWWSKDEEILLPQ